MSNKLDQNQSSAQKNYNEVNYENMSSSSASDEENNQFNISETKNIDKRFYEGLVKLASNLINSGALDVFP